MKSLNRNQRLVLVALAVAVAIVQLLMFEENGMRGYGWILSFLVIAGALILYFRESQRPTPLNAELQSQSGKSDETLTFNDLIFQLDRLYRTTVRPPISEDVTSKVIQRDIIFGAINPFAYGLIVLKRSKASAAYISTPEHSELLSMVVKRIVTSRTQITRGMAAGIPIPGADISPDVQAIKSKVLMEVQAAFNAITDGGKLRPEHTAIANLLTLFLESAPYLESDQKKNELRSAASAFAMGYVEA